MANITPEGRAAMKRLQAAGYMETTYDQGGFSCGHCKYARPSKEQGIDSDGYETELGQCSNAAVRALVSPEHGCCNLYEPADGRPIPPEQWAAFK